MIEYFLWSLAVVSIVYALWDLYKEKHKKKCDCPKYNAIGYVHKTQLKLTPSLTVHQHFNLPDSEMRRHLLVYVEQ